MPSDGVQELDCASSFAKDTWKVSDGIGTIGTTCMHVVSINGRVPKLSVVSIISRVLRN